MEAKKIQAELVLSYLESSWRGRGHYQKENGRFVARTEEQKQFDYALATAIKVAKPIHWGKENNFKNNKELAEWVLTHPKVLACLK